MSKIQAIMPIILVIFPRSLALLCAEATGELFVFTIICTYSPIMERHGKNNFMIIMNTDRDVRKIEPDEIKLNLQMSLGDELGSKPTSNKLVPVRPNYQSQQKKT